MSSSSIPTATQIGEKLRHHVVESMEEMARGSEAAQKNHDPSQGIWYPREFIHAFEKTHKHTVQTFYQSGVFGLGYMNPKYFNRLTAGTNYRAFAFISKKDVLPSEAVKAATKGLSILDCGSACQAARYDGVRKLLGDKKFDRLFAETGVVIEYEDRDASQPMNYLTDFTPSARKYEAGSVGNRPVKVGHIVSFNGVRDYSKKHPQGMDANFNVICCNDTSGKQKYIGHGIPSTGMTEEEIALLLIHEYNKTPECTLRTARKVFPSSDNLCMEGRDPGKNTKNISLMPTTDPFTRVVGYDWGSPQGFRIKLIENLYSLSINEISMTYIKKHPAANKMEPLPEPSEEVLQNLSDHINSLTLLDEKSPSLLDEKKKS